MGNYFFRKTKIPDILALLSVGILLGPIFKLIEPEGLAHFAEYFGSFALLIILFEGGMDMALERVVKEFGAASFLVIASFVLSVLSIAAFLHYLYGWDMMRSLLLAAILGCTSSAIVIPIINRMSIGNEIKTTLAVESAMSDVLAVVFTVYLIEFITLKHIGIKTPFRAIASSFSIAMVLGSAAGFLWLKILDFLKNQKYSYMATLSAILVTYASIEFLGGSGPIAILIFGVILGNSDEFIKLIKLKGNLPVSETIKFFHGEVTFFIRTFFFVYMGMMISPEILRVEYLLPAISIVLIIVAARYTGTQLLGQVFHEKKEDRHIALAMLPRGLASAVLATLPISANIKGTEHFIEYVFIVIVATSAIMTVGVFIIEKNKKPENI